MLYIVGWVTGVTHLDNIMYVVCESSSTIRLYNMDTDSLISSIDVQGMKSPHDIVICRQHRQLYIADLLYCIWRVSVDGHKSVKWLTIDANDRFVIQSLSLTSQRLTVTSRHPPSLRQYNITDRLKTVIELPTCVQRLYHAVESTHDTFIVAHQGTSEDKDQCAVSELFDVSVLLTNYE